MGDLNELEKEFVRAWIDKEEQNCKHFETLENAWRLFDIERTSDKTDLDKEWNYFKRNVTAPHLKVACYESEQGDSLPTIGAVQKSWHRISMAVMIAATFFLLILTGIHFYFKGESATIAMVQTEERKKLSPVSKTKIERNLSEQPKKLTIDDGSEVVLYENSEISFVEGFPGEKRDIKLYGKAIFKVSKDKTKPFTVYSGDVTTTALGTKFSVSSYDDQNKIIIRLYEGKIVVKSSPESVKKMSMDYFLIAGNELEYNKINFNAVVRPLHNVKNADGNMDQSEQQIMAERRSLVLDRPDTWIMFNNQGLDQVLDQLALIFDQKISYSRQDIRKTYFIGKFDKSEGLKNILEQIAELNGLQVISKENDFEIRKAKVN
jgi:ferric-dicitrate binding protein FerR (iron transport regulator)